MAETARQYGAKDITFFWVGDGDSPEKKDDTITIKSASENFAAGTEIILKKLS